MKLSDDIIAAPATPPGRGAVAVVRASGPDLGGLAQRLTGRALQPRRAHYVSFRDDAGRIIDRGLALFFPAPRSYTGEDLLELHCHGSPAIVESLLQRLFQLGARPAEPGEFTRRAFLNGKLDLAQAEAVAALIESSSAQAARAAQRSLEGEFSRQTRALTESLTRLRIQVEAAIDFSDEDIALIAEGAVLEKLQGILADLDALRRRAHQGRLLEEGMTVVIAGPPNAGKSSLLNALARREAAIVTPIAGTTRDVLRERILIDGMPLHVIDTAGLRHSDDPVEREGIRRARAELARADRILLVGEDRPPAGRDLPGLPTDIPVTRIVNKIDLSGQPPRIEGDTVWLSAKTGAGLDLLRRHLNACMGFEAEAEDALAARRRHLEALARARGHLEQALAELEAGQMLDLAAENLRLAQNALGEITGEVTSDDLLGRIFSEFCIGK
ncbi:tRNA modification GTPase [Methylomarinovum caldicuralii]|uniref:tRNA modification GTPase MnmE n=1 Tax=Methylomarinovum caldicuralii TaxID=438856 RepID=A0AAU9CU65_9GAMM|nr:tRNA uridine-5-carboxymethylaminomethyl(34) synthesis GTPase MnmE [Methylomarinovum caldicuralii]BCX83037.1 tRNA modification GTPase [Methylomarinovum caldicuralii]